MALEPPGEDDDMDMAIQKANADEEYDNANDAGVLTKIHQSYYDISHGVLSLVLESGFVFLYFLYKCLRDTVKVLCMMKTRYCTFF